MEQIFDGFVNQAGQLSIKNKNNFAFHLAGLADKDVEVIVRCKIKRRTEQQNKALHLWFTLLAEALNSAGYDMKKVMHVDIPWTDYNIKEFLWRPVQKAMFGKVSTTQLDTGDIDKIYDVVNKTIAERTGIHVPFPSIEHLMEEY